MLKLITNHIRVKLYLIAVILVFRLSVLNMQLITTPNKTNNLKDPSTTVNF